MRAMAKRRKTLPKGIEAQMKAAAESGDYDEVHAALERCDPNATGGFSKGTLLFMRTCSPELARWAVARGTDVNARDQHGKTALHQSAGAPFNHLLLPDVLLELGAEVGARATSGETPLHSAASARHAHAARLLIDAGADVEAQTKRGQTPLEFAIQRAHNAQLPRLLAFVDVMLDAGAKVSDDAREFMKKVSEEFEFHRANFNAELLDEASAALEQLCTRIDVAPARTRQMHDGKSPIVATSDTWQKQHAELWNLLVPSKGACATVQGEVVRIAGRISDEIARNGGGNWDKDYRAMASVFCEHVASNTSVPAALQHECEELVARLPKDDDSAAALARAAVKWVELNPDPIALPSPKYSR